MQLLDHSDGLLARCGDVLAGVDRLEHGRDLAHLRRGHVAEDVAVLFRTAAETLATTAADPRAAAQAPRCQARYRGFIPFKMGCNY